MDSTETWYN